MVPGIPAKNSAPRKPCIEAKRAIFSPAGLTFYGGLIVVAISLVIYFRVKRLAFLRVADAIAPALIIAYGIGRIGFEVEAVLLGESARQEDDRRGARAAVDHR